MSRLIDKVLVTVRAGAGGSGALAYTAHKRKRLLGPGFPCGGNGGRGGDVSVIAKLGVRSLGSISPTLVAGNGANGTKERRHGSVGKSLEIHVPVGTQVWHKLSEKDGQNSEKVLLGDLIKDSQSVCVAQGSAGGQGNNSVQPHTKTAGYPGSEKRIILELKTIADIGLVGFPNSGKSSLLSLISRAAPKIASYPFTTLQPHLGMVSQIVVADIPGLVEDAHLDRGMGHEFLRHIVRTRALLFVIDASGTHWDTKSTSLVICANLVETLKTLRNEIVHYDFGMSKKPWAVFLNKMDTDFDALSIKGLEEYLETMDENFRGLVKGSVKLKTGREEIIHLIKSL